MQNPVSITSVSSISPLGTTTEEVWNNYKKPFHHISLENYEEKKALVAKLDEKSSIEIDALRKENSQFAGLDDSVLFGVFAAREAVNLAKWKTVSNFGINIGSSRGATDLFEKYHQEFLDTGISSTLSSPTTTLGNISSWVAQDLKSTGPEISHSITCSTALHAVLNGVAWLQSGLSDAFIVGGSEAPLTPFTIAQMKALKIYVPEEGNKEYPCQALNLDKTRNSMFLGEGAAIACLENGIKDNAVGLISGIGYATEPLTHNISISANGDCFKKSMKMALGITNPNEVDAIVLHAPGTVKGDLAEYNAIKGVFGDRMPGLTTNKWKIGHTFGASGILSMELAILMMKHQEFIPVPYIEYESVPQKIRKVIVNAVGFGGNAVSILLELPPKK